MFSMIQRTSAFFFTASAVFALTLSVHTSVRADDVAQEEAYKAAKKEYGKWLKSKDPKEREAAALAYAKTNHSKAAEDVLEALTKETDNTIATVMGRSIQHLNSPECIAAIEKDVLKLKSGSELFTAYYAFQGIALGKSEGGDALIRKAILQTKDSEMYIKVAALEAIALAKHTAAADIVMELLKTKGKTWEKEHILIPISACTAAARVWNEENRFKLVESLIGVLEQYENDRIKYFAAQALSVITMQKAYWDVKFWRYWLSMEGAVGDDEGKTSARAPKPTFFDMEVVGNRVVFVIDISGSMQYPVAPPENWVKKPKSKTDNKKKVKTGEGKEGEGKEGEKEEPEKEDLDWSKIKTKMDLAKAELIRTLNSFDENYHVNVVTYGTKHQLLIPGIKNFVACDKSNKQKLTAAVSKLQPIDLTNIHGAMIHGFSITTKGEAKNDPAWDADALVFGAETMFFLTDGAPTWSDDSKGQDASGMGDGKFVNPQAIVDDIARVNTFRKMVIHTVGIGIHDSGLLSYLAATNGGTYTDLSGAATQ